MAYKQLYKPYPKSKTKLTPSRKTDKYSKELSTKRKFNWKTKKFDGSKLTIGQILYRKGYIKSHRESIDVRNNNKNKIYGKSEKKSNYYNNSRRYQDYLQGVDNAMDGCEKQDNEWKIYAKEIEDNKRELL